MLSRHIFFTKIYLAPHFRIITKLYQSENLYPCKFATLINKYLQNTRRQISTEFIYIFPEFVNAFVNRNSLPDKHLPRFC